MNAKKYPTELVKETGPFNAPTVAFFGKAATGKIDEMEFALFCKDATDCERIWGRFMEWPILDLSMVQDAAIVPAHGLRAEPASTPGVSE